MNSLLTITHIAITVDYNFGIRLQGSDVSNAAARAGFEITKHDDDGDVAFGAYQRGGDDNKISLGSGTFKVIMPGVFEGQFKRKGASQGSAFGDSADRQTHSRTEYNCLEVTSVNCPKVGGGGLNLATPADYQNDVEAEGEVVGCDAAKMNVADFKGFLGVFVANVAGNQRIPIVALGQVVKMKFVANGLKVGEDAGGANLTVGSPIYCTGNAGKVSGTAPDTLGEVIYRVGWLTDQAKGLVALAPQFMAYAT